MKDEKLQQARSILHDYLRYGKENAISCRELALLTGMSERAVQRAVHEIRWRFADVILSESGKGYWLSNDREEIQAFIDRRDRENRGRFITVRNIRKELRKDAKQMSMGTIIRETEIV